MENRDGIIKKIKEKIAKRRPDIKKTTNKYTGETATTTLRPKREKEIVKKPSGDYSISKKKLDKEGNIKKDVTKSYGKDGKLKEKIKLKFKKLRNAEPGGPSMSTKVVKKAPGQKKEVQKTTGYSMPAGTKKMNEYLKKIRKKL